MVLELLTLAAGSWILARLRLAPTSLTQVISVQELIEAAITEWPGSIKRREIASGPELTAENWLRIMADPFVADLFVRIDGSNSNSVLRLRGLGSQGEMQSDPTLDDKSQIDKLAYQVACHTPRSLYAFMGFDDDERRAYYRRPPRGDRYRVLSMCVGQATVNNVPLTLSRLWDKTPPTTPLPVPQLHHLPEVVDGEARTQPL